MRLLCYIKMVKPPLLGLSRHALQFGDIYFG